MPRTGMATVALQATVAHMVVTRQEPSRTHGPRAPAPAMVDRPAGTTLVTAPRSPATALKPPTPTPPTHTQASSNRMVDQLKS